jgi:uncharacterized protein YbjT (DUF2867 family)
MKVFVFGSGGDIGGHVLKQLAARGHEAVAMAETEIRAEELRMQGASKAIVATEKNFIGVLAGCDAVIYIARDNPIAGENKNMLVDHQAAIRAVEEARQQGVKRFVYLSPVRPDESEKSKETGAKDEPEEMIRHSGLVYTVIRSAKSASKPATGTIAAAPSIPDAEGEIPFEDVAAVLVEAINSESAANRSFEIAPGPTAISEALRALQ